MKMKLGQQISFQRIYILKTTMMYEAEVSQHLLYKKNKQIDIDNVPKA